MNALSLDACSSLIDLALEEDLGEGDVTSLSVIPDSLEWSARMVAREELTVAGIPVVTEVFRRLDGNIQIIDSVEDGDRVTAGATILGLRGKARTILSGERVALNFAQRLSGVATLTRRYVDAVADYPCEILDTRKTTPGWRQLEKYAVLCGGGTNHRVGLFDMVMIKDNHLAVLSESPNPIEAAVAKARAAYPSIKVEVEADTVEQAAVAAEAGADVILLDNMSVSDLRESLERIDGRSKTEASGGITLDRIPAVAETGVDYISVGALTHSAASVDIALDIEGDSGG